MYLPNDDLVKGLIGHINGLWKKLDMLGVVSVSETAIWQDKWYGESSFQICKDVDRAFYESISNIRADWQITCWYLVMLAVIVLVAKISSLRAAGSGRHIRTVSFFLAPSLCVTAWQKRGRLEDAAMRWVIFRALLMVAVIAAVYLYGIPEIRRYSWWLQSYLAIVPFWLLLETVDALCRLLWLPSGRVVPAVNIRPWQAKNVSDFWGRHWNRLFGDWLHQVVFMRMRRWPLWASLVTFLVSGLLHELLVSLPLQIVYGKSVWGWMAAYFLLQYLALLLERCLFPASPIAQRLLLWLAVLGPVPLVLNPGTLLIFHLGG